MPFLEAQLSHCSNSSVFQPILDRLLKLRLDHCDDQVLARQLLGELKPHVQMVERLIACDLRVKLRTLRLMDSAHKEKLLNFSGLDFDKVAVLVERSQADSLQNFTAELRRDERLVINLDDLVVFQEYEGEPFLAYDTLRSGPPIPTLEVRVILPGEHEAHPALYFHHRALKASSGGATTPEGERSTRIDLLGRSRSLARSFLTKRSSFVISSTCSSRWSWSREAPARHRILQKHRIGSRPSTVSPITSSCCLATAASSGALTMAVCEWKIRRAG